MAPTAALGSCCPAWQPRAGGRIEFNLSHAVAPPPCCQKVGRVCTRSPACDVTTPRRRRRGKRSSITHVPRQCHGFVCIVRMCVGRGGGSFWPIVCARCWRCLSCPLLGPSPPSALGDRRRPEEARYIGCGLPCETAACSVNLGRLACLSNTCVCALQRVGVWYSPPNLPGETCATPFHRAPWLSWQSFPILEWRQLAGSLPPLPAML